jgi:HAD superfamily hydrolase (TIGR01509 family)
MSIDGVIFDMDGVLTDSEPLICRAAVAMFREKGLTVQPEDFVPFVGSGEDRYIGGVAEKYNLVPRSLEPFPGATELVCNCRSAGLRIAVASSADPIKIEANLRKIGLPPEGWDAVVTAFDVARRKPFPDIFLTAAGKLGLAPVECVVVEDAVNGVEAARAAGMRCVAVAQTFPAGKLARANLVRDTIADISLGDLRSL